MLTPAYFTLPFEEATELVAALLVVEARLAAVVTGALLAAAVVVALMEVAALVVVGLTEVTTLVVWGAELPAPGTHWEYQSFWAAQ